MPHLILCAILLTFGACTTAPAMERAATMPANTSRVAAGVQAYDLVSGSETLLPVAPALSYRRGMTDSVDAAVRLSFAGATLGARYQILDRGALTISIGADMGGSFVSGDLFEALGALPGPDELIGIGEGRVYLEYEVIEGVGLMAVPTVRGVSQTEFSHVEDDGTERPTATERVLLVGVDFVVPVQLEMLTFFPTLGIGRAWGDIGGDLFGKLSAATYFNLGMGLAF